MVKLENKFCIMNNYLNLTSWLLKRKIRKKMDKNTFEIDNFH